MLDKEMPFKWGKNIAISAIFLLSLETTILAAQTSETALSSPHYYPFEGSPQILAQRQKRTALVIGNSNYGATGNLNNPRNDSADMAQTLRGLGFQVIFVQDSNKQEFDAAIEQFSQQLRQGGVGLFYYAGHGFQVRGENYLIPVGANIRREQDVQYEAVPLGRILGAMEDANNSVNLVLLDACRDNPFARGWRSLGNRGLAPVSARGTLISFATGPGNVAADGVSRNSPYTESLLKHIQTPGLAVEQLFKKVRQEVEQKTQKAQSPWEQSNLVGDFSFKPGTQVRPSQSVSTVTTPVQQRIPKLLTHLKPDSSAYEKNIIFSQSSNWGAKKLPYKKAVDIKDALVDSLIGRVTADRHMKGQGLFRSFAPYRGYRAYISLWGSNMEGCFVDMIIQHVPTKGRDRDTITPTQLELGIGSELVQLSPASFRKPKVLSQRYESGNWYMTRTRFIVDSNAASLLSQAPSEETRVRITLLSGDQIMVPIHKKTVSSWKHAYSFNPGCVNGQFQ